MNVSIFHLIPVILSDNVAHFRDNNDACRFSAAPVIEKLKSAIDACAIKHKLVPPLTPMTAMLIGFDSALVIALHAV